MIVDNFRIIQRHYYLPRKIIYSNRYVSPLICDLRSLRSTSFIICIFYNINTCPFCDLQSMSSSICTSTCLYFCGLSHLLYIFFAHPIVLHPFNMHTNLFFFVDFLQSTLYCTYLLWINEPLMPQ